MAVRSGPVLMIFAGLCFALMLAGVKTLRAELSTLEVICWRGVVATPLALLWARGRPLQIRRLPAMGARLVLGVLGMGCYYSATRTLPLADLSLITRLQPILIALLAPAVLGAGERGGRRLWGLLLLGAAGCAVLLQPKLAVGSVGALWAVGALVFSAGAHLALRALGGEDSRAVVLWTQAGYTALASAALIATTGGWLAVPRPEQLPALLSVGVLATAGQLLLTRAYALDRASVVAGASNVFPVWAVLLDVAVFATPPSGAALLGGALILSASLGLIFSTPEEA